MKNFAFSMLVLAMMSLAGCGSKPIPAPSVETLASAASTLAQEPAAFASAASRIAGTDSGKTTNTTE